MNKNITGWKSGKMFLLVVSIFVLSMFSASVLGAECSDSGTNKFIEYSPADLGYGEPFNLTYRDAWTSSGQIQLNLTGTHIFNLTPLTANLTSDGTGGGYYTWLLNSTAPGKYNVSVIVNYGGGCTVTRELTIKSGGEPYLTATMDDISTVIAGIPQSFNLNLTNNGDGNASNISGSWINNVNPSSYFLSNLSNCTSTTLSFNLDDSYCALRSIESTINYYDVNGIEMQPVHVGDNYTVIGSDLDITSFTVSNNNPTEGDSVTFHITVRNNGDYTAESSQVCLYRGSYSNLIGCTPNYDVGVNTSYTFSLSWTASPYGSFNIIANASSPRECSNMESDNSASLGMSIEKSGGNNNNDGSTTGGGVYVNTYYINFSEKNPVLLNIGVYDKVEFDYNNITYVISFDNLTSNSIIVKISPVDITSIIDVGGFRKYNIDSDLDYDLMIEYNNYVSSENRAIMTFSWIKPERKPVEGEQQPVEEEQPTVTEEIAHGMVNVFGNVTNATRTKGVSISVAIIVIGLLVYMLIRRKRL